MVAISLGTYELTVTGHRSSMAMDYDCDLIESAEGLGEPDVSTGGRGATSRWGGRARHEFLVHRRSCVLTYAGNCVLYGFTSCWISAVLENIPRRVGGRRRPGVKNQYTLPRAQNEGEMKSRDQPAPSLKAVN